MVMTVNAQVAFPPDRDRLLSGEVSGQALVAEKMVFPLRRKLFR